MRNQLFASACLSLDQNCDIGGRDMFDLFEQGFQRRTVSYNPLEPAVKRKLIAISGNW
jgi:hypothetical protein